MKLLTVDRGAKGYLVLLDTLDAKSEFVRQERMETELAGQIDETAKAWVLRSVIVHAPDDSEVVVDPFHPEDFRPYSLGAEFATNGFYGFLRQSTDSKTRWVFLVHQKMVKVQ